MRQSIGGGFDVDVDPVSSFPLPMLYKSSKNSQLTTLLQQETPLNPFQNLIHIKIGRKIFSVSQYCHITL